MELKKIVRNEMDLLGTKPIPRAAHRLDLYSANAVSRLVDRSVGTSDIERVRPFPFAEMAAIGGPFSVL